MGDGIYVAAAGAVAQSNALDVTANNVANASTTGFRGTRVTFKPDHTIFEVHEYDFDTLSTLRRTHPG